MTLRQYRPADLPAVYDICARTADAGGDSRGQYSTDDLMPDLFAGPYLRLEPELSFVLDNDRHGAVGYVLGTADTVSFARAYRATWIPRIGQRYPVPADSPTTSEEAMVALHYRPERMIIAELTAYPAHLHVNLLPGYQGAGHGRAMINHFLRGARQRGAAAVHVAVITTNTRARGFYDRLGFQPIDVPDAGPVTYLGRTTEPGPPGSDRSPTTRCGNPSDPPRRSR